MKNILHKLSKVQADIEKMEKDGTNTFQNYKYLSETQITYKMKTLFDKYGVLFKFSSTVQSCVPYTTAKGGSNFLTTVRVAYDFIDAETGETSGGSVDGQGSDSGDKGVYKAMTGAIKYIYMKTFNIPTGDDPENEKKNSKPVKGFKKTREEIESKPPFGEGSESED